MGDKEVCVICLVAVELNSPHTSLLEGRGGDDFKMKLH